MRLHRGVFSGLRTDYVAIVADPPWLYQKQPGSKGLGAGPAGTAERHYSTMTNEAIAELPVGDLASADSHLFLWVTNPGLNGGRFSDVTPFRIVEAWGFRYQTMLTWLKVGTDGKPIRNGMGWYFRGCTEHVLYATRGKARIPPRLRVPNVIMAQRGLHSEKPEQMTQLVETVVPRGPYVELFARSRRSGWDVWGDEVTAA